MDTKKIKLSTGKEIKIREMSIDEQDTCNDTAVIKIDKDGDTVLRDIVRARTAWLRCGLVDGKKDIASDKLIKSLTEDERNEASLAIKEFQEMGEENPSH